MHWETRLAVKINDRVLEAYCVVVCFMSHVMVR